MQMLLEDKIEIKIDKIEYLGLENSNLPQVKVNIKDAIENVSLDKGKISVLVSRTLECTPKCMFHIYTSFIVVRYLSASNEKINVETIKKEIMEDPNSVVGPAFSISSTIISSLISAGGNLPIITPPGFTVEKK